MWEIQHQNQNTVLSFVAYIFILTITQNQFEKSDFRRNINSKFWLTFKKYNMLLNMLHDFLKIHSKAYTNKQQWQELPKITWRTDDPFQKMCYAHICTTEYCHATNSSVAVWCWNSVVIGGKALAVLSWNIEPRL